MLIAPDVPIPGTRTLEGNRVELANPAMPMKCTNPLFDAKSFLPTKEQQPQENDSSCPQSTFPATATAAFPPVTHHVSEHSKNSDNSSTEIMDITSSPNPATLKPLLPPSIAATSVQPEPTPAANTAAVASALAAPTIRRPPSSSSNSRLVNSSWPEALVSTHFFGNCSTHAGQRKNELNLFCLGCGPSHGEGSLMCQYCADEHTTCCDGACIQLYRYMYHDIVRVAAVNHLIDLSGIQQYRANGHPAVHLRPMGPPANKSPYSSMCDGGCGRCLDPQWAYCSLSCKLGLADAAGDGDRTADGCYERRVPSGNNTTLSYITTTTGTNNGAFTKGGKRSSTKYGNGNTRNTCGTTASNSEGEEEGYHHHHHHSNNNDGRKWSSGSYKRAMMMMMVSRKALKGAKRRKPVHPLRSDSL